MEILTFDKDSHLKPKYAKYGQTSSDESSVEDQRINSTQSRSDENDGKTFKRKFRNLDGTSCWLKSCLQLVLASLDYSQTGQSFTSELGLELFRLQNCNLSCPLESTEVKHIIVAAEDTRIATRLSELEEEYYDPLQLEHRIQDVENLRLNLISGQQCVQDFFLCLNENLLSWPDVFSNFGFNITHSTVCCSCKHVSQSETHLTIQT